MDVSSDKLKFPVFDSPSVPDISIYVLHFGRVGYQQTSKPFYLRNASSYSDIRFYDMSTCPAYWRNNINIIFLNSFRVVFKYSFVCLPTSRLVRSCRSLETTLSSSREGIGSLQFTVNSQSKNKCSVHLRAGRGCKGTSFTPKFPQLTFRRKGEIFLAMAGLLCFVALFTTRAT